MKKILLTTLSLFAFTFSVSAASLTDALKITFQNNLELKAERKNLEVQREVLKFMQTYQRVTQNMFKFAPKYSTIVINLNRNHQIKSIKYKR